MPTATAPSNAAKSSRRIQSTSPASGSSSPAAGERWYVNDPSTKRIDTSGNPALANQIQELEASSLPPTVKQAALAGLRQQLAAAKPLTLTISRAQKAGARDLVEVAGDFKNKLLSPSLVAALVARPEFVAKFLAEFNNAD
jgi:hypothetical protein